MSTMAEAIVPRSDQLNSDDLLAGPITITVTEVTIRSGEQPVSIHYEGDNGKPYKSCKSMNRVLVMCWGPDAKNYIGRSMTLYRDPTVKWAGQEIGGIRISHLSHLDSAVTMALTATKGSRKPFTVKPLEKKKPLTKEERTAKVMAAFGPVGVTEEALQEFLGKDAGTATVAELEAAMAHFTSPPPTEQEQS